MTRVIRQLTDGNRIFSSYTPDRGLLFGIYKELQKLNIKEPLTRPFNKWATELSRQFSKQ